MNNLLRYLFLAPLLLSSCEFNDRLSSGSARHVLVSEVWAVKNGKQIVTREYEVTPKNEITPTRTPSTASTNYDEPGEHVTISRKQLIQAIRSAVQNAHLASAKLVAAEDEQYRLVSHQLARKWVMSAPNHHGHEGFDCEDIARRAEDIARAQSCKAHKRFAFGLCKGKLRSTKEFHMVNLYFDPIQGACLIDNNGKSMEWSDFSSIEMAIIM
jgi:hypothetical protein